MLPEGVRVPQSDDDAFDGVITETYRDAVPSWPTPVSSAGRPNVVFVVIDDMGYGTLGCYGSEIRTPSVDALAADGVQFTNFHATALCSPTRASLLTGRNSHAVGMAYLSNVDDGFPGYRGRISHRAGTLAEMLVGQGYNTMALGKWHLAPIDQTSASGPYDQWPLGRGFERFYGFLEALTDQYYPELFSDNHPVDPPAAPEDGYHLTTDLVDHALGFITDQTSVTPEKPFFCYLALGATHTPFQAPADFVARYRGCYDEGWDVIRERRYRRQLELGVIPPGTALPPSNDDVVSWAGLDDAAQRAYVRYQEVYAGFVEHTDAEIGRLMDGLRRLGRMDDTIVVLLSDNGASQEGGQHGVLNTTHYENGHFPDLDEVIARQGEIDGRTAQVNYPLGWAQAANTPLRRYKQNTHAGGIRTPMIMKLAGNRASGQRRSGFQHVSDIVPTVLDLVGIEPPTQLHGVEQLPITGRSMVETLASAESASASRTQYFETVGHRAIWKDGWKAVAFHQQGSDFSDDRWELYDLDNDFSETFDLADKEPDKLAELIDSWWSEARANQVLPLDDRGFAQRSNVRFRPHSPRGRQRFRYLNGMQHLGNGAAAPVAGRSFKINTTVDRPTGSEGGVLIAHGSWNSGYALLISDGYLVYDLNHYGSHHLVRSTRALPAGRARLGMIFDKDRDGTGGTVSLSVDGEQVARQRLDATFENFIAFQGLDVGADRLSPVRENGHGAHEFSGTFDQVTIEFLDPLPLVRDHEPLD